MMVKVSGMMVNHDGEGVWHVACLGHARIVFKFVVFELQKRGIHSGHVLLLTVVFCWVDRCVGSWVLRGLFGLLHLTQNRDSSAREVMILPDPSS